VMVRSIFPEAASGDALPIRFFPSATAVTSSFPSVAEVRMAFEDVGWRLRHRRGVDEVVAPTRRHYLRRLGRRADSLVREVTDDEFAAGLQAARRWAEEAPEEPVCFRLELLRFRGRGAGRR
jgi:glutamate/tyrosine decarboxylase-like PLP-dependent enzyme